VNGIPPDFAARAQSLQSDAERPVTEEMGRVERDHVPALLDGPLRPTCQIGHHGEPPANKKREGITRQHAFNLRRRLIDTPAGKESANRMAKVDKR
jgi:hypothetical protein